MAHPHHGSWTNRTQGDELEGMPDGSGAADYQRRQGFKNHHSTLGAVHTRSEGLGVAGRILHLFGVFVPMLAGELVHDATKYKKTVRLASIGTAIGYELLHLLREQQRQNALTTAKLAECQGRE
jgi:hypothetical protein